MCTLNNEVLQHNKMTQMKLRGGPLDVECLLRQLVNHKSLYTVANIPITRHVAVGDSPFGSIDLFLITTNNSLFPLLYTFQFYCISSSLENTTLTYQPLPPPTLVPRWEYDLRRLLLVRTGWPDRSINK